MTPMERFRIWLSSGKFPVVCWSLFLAQPFPVFFVYMVRVCASVLQSSTKLIQITY